MLLSVYKFESLDQWLRIEQYLQEPHKTANHQHSSHSINHIKTTINGSQLIELNTSILVPFLLVLTLQNGQHTCQEETAGQLISCSKLDNVINSRWSSWARFYLGWMWYIPIHFWWLLIAMIHYYQQCCYLSGMIHGKNS